MEDLRNNRTFMAAYDRLAAVSLNPRRHTASDARAHSEAVAALATCLGTENRCVPEEIALLTNVGYAHDVGKITGSAKPARSIEVLASCNIADPILLGLVKWHDTSLPWYRSAKRGQAPSDKAWRRLSSELDLRLLCIFMVADRVDAPGGWRRNAPTTWFISEARSRGLVGELKLDVDDHPSEVCAGAALVKCNRDSSKVLLTRTRALGFELPKGGIEWNELTPEAAVRELREEAGVGGEFRAADSLGHLDYFIETSQDRHLKRVLYYLVYSEGEPNFSKLPARTRELKWVQGEDLDSIPLVNEELRGVLQLALKKGRNHV